MTAEQHENKKIRRVGRALSTRWGKLPPRPRPLRAVLTLIVLSPTIATVNPRPSPRSSESAFESAIERSSAAAIRPSTWMWSMCRLLRGQYARYLGQQRREQLPAGRVRELQPMKGGGWDLPGTEKEKTSKIRKICFDTCTCTLLARLDERVFVPLFRLEQLYYCQIL